MPVLIKMTFDFVDAQSLIANVRLQAAIDDLSDKLETHIEWLPYERYPNTPVEGVNRSDFRTALFGSSERSKTEDARIATAAIMDAFVFDFDAIERVPNTFAAHRLSWLAARLGVQETAVTALLRAYFEQGRDIGDPAILTDIAAEIGMDPLSTRQFLAGDQGVADVRELIETAAMTVGDGNPHLDIGGASFTGAMPVSVLKDAILEAHADISV
ncbi:MAG: DsbA family oxidoreductase [Pseudomonadota bacterium]